MRVEKAKLPMYGRLLGWRVLWPSLCSALILVGACSSGGQDPEVTIAEDPPGIGVRTPHPTFTATPPPLVNTATMAAVAVAPTNPPLSEPTPTPAAPAETPTPVPPTATPLPTATLPEPPADPILVINSSDVNVRAGPGTEFEILAVTDRGQEYQVVGKNSTGNWWQICCIEGENGWVTSEFADTDGPVDQVAVVGETTPTVATGGSEQVSAATVTTAVTPTATALSFDLVVQEQFPESTLVRIFLYVYDKDTGLEGYSLQVKRDGAELRIKQTSFGGSPGLTWPIADVRQRSQNMKVEFPGIAPAGQWVVQLTKDGTPVGPPATFTLTANEPNQELYVRYQKRP